MTLAVDYQTHKINNIPTISYAYTFKDEDGNSLFLVLKHSFKKLSLEKTYEGIEDPYIKYILDKTLLKSSRYYTICGYYVPVAGTNRVIESVAHSSGYTKVNFGDSPYGQANSIEGVFSSMISIRQCLQEIELSNDSPQARVTLTRDYKRYYKLIVEEGSLPEYYKSLPLPTIKSK